MLQVCRSHLYEGEESHETLPRKDCQSQGVIQTGSGETHEKDLVTAPRRMTVDDVGYAPKERDTWSKGNVMGCERDTTPTPPEQCTGQNDCTDAHPEPSSDEDVFDFGKGLDEA